MQQDKEEMIARSLMHGFARESGKEFPWHQEDGVRQAVHDLVEADPPEWWFDVEFGAEQCVFAGTESGLALLARATDETVEVRYLGSLSGASYVERWRDHRLFLEFTHDRLPGPIELEIRPSRLETFAAMRRFFREATRSAVAAQRVA